ncbi:hypothetical protein DAERI_060106 [Deinococcus aerius]|uniref:Uncharacterized protein n=1 Tax=Deinococcus aerius TaxID=200253 RepID=A0A2I9D5B0_9DEIO|nr:DUF3168 domain-containing protein [Deinococcus aerius]GBF05846.1 hypothetical protein DAERI_060106 [Deinococcus aerius]
MKTRDQLKAALEALKGLEGATVVLRGKKAPPEAARLVVLDHIVSTPIGTYEADSDQVVVQVGAYAEAYDGALALAEEAHALLDAAGFLRQSDRPAPFDPGDAQRGVLTDYTR